MASVSGEFHHGQGSGQRNQLEIQDVVLFLLRHWRLGLGCVVICLGLAVAYLAAATPRYTATAQILFSSSRERTIGAESNLSDATLDPAALESQVNLLQSTAVLTKVVDDEALTKDPEFLSVRYSHFQRLRHRLFGGEIEPKNPKTTAILALRGATHVDRVGKSYVVGVSVTTKDPEKSARLANALANVYIADRVSTSAPMGQRSVRLITPAVPPLNASEPRDSLVLALASFGGIVLALGMALAMEARAQGFSTPHQVTMLLGLPVWSLVRQITPRDQRMADRFNAKIRRRSDAISDKVFESKGGYYKRFRSRIDPVGLLLAAPFTEFSESIKKLRGNIQLAIPPGYSKVIQVTSAVSGEGKSSTAMCLATSAAEAGYQVVLIDADMRRASTTEYFRLRRREGLTELVTGQSDFSSVIHYDARTGVHVMPVGTQVDDPVRILESPRMRDVATDLSEKFDYIIIDSPPLGPVIDAAVIARFADCIVYVVKWNSTPLATALAAVQQLQIENKKVGAVLNLIDPRRAIKFDRYAYEWISSESGEAYYQSPKIVRGRRSAPRAHAAKEEDPPRDLENIVMLRGASGDNG